MAGIFLQPRISALLVARIEGLLETLEDLGEIQEGLKALAEGEGTITWEQYQRQRKESEPQRELSG